MQARCGRNLLAWTSTSHADGDASHLRARAEKTRNTHDTSYIRYIMSHLIPICARDTPPRPSLHKTITLLLFLTKLEILLYIPQYGLQNLAPYPSPLLQRARCYTSSRSVYTLPLLHRSQLKSNHSSLTESRREPQHNNHGYPLSSNFSVSPPRNTMETSLRQWHHSRRHALHELRCRFRCSCGLDACG